MKVLIITGDKTFGPGHERYELQRTAVEELRVTYWGAGSYWPTLPREAFDVVTSQDPFWRGLYAWYAARRLNAQVNVQVHTDLSAQPLWRHVLAQIVLRHADSVRVVSEKIKAQVLSYGVRAPVRVLSIFVDLARFRAVVRLPHAQKTILWVGRFEEEKNPRGALEVLDKVRRNGVDARLIMLGAGSMLRALQHHAKGWPVVFPGWQPTERYLGEADVVLATSWHESWGASTIEALAAGVPVVSPDVGVAKEAGAIVAPRAALADAVAKVLTEGATGTLMLTMPSADEWAAQWKNTLQ